MPRPDPTRLAALLEGFPAVKLLVVGDAMLDEHLWGEVERVSPEAPVPVVRVESESLDLGGAANVVRNVVALGGRCSLAAVVGDDEAGRRLADRLGALGVDPKGLVVEPGRPTTQKTRVIARSQHVVRFDRESEEPIARAVARAMLRYVEAELPGVDGVILEDYGKGILTPGLVRQVLRRAAAAGVPVAVDPKGELGSYRGASLLKPNLREAEALAGLRVRGPRDLDRAVERLRRRLPGCDFVVTRGAGGMRIYEGSGPGTDVRTVAREVFDVQGAGDTTIATLALALRAGASLLEAAVLANAAAGVVVGKVGTAVARPDEVRRLLPEAAEATGELP